MYTIELKSVGFNIFQLQSFNMDTATSRFTMDRKSLDFPSTEAPPWEKSHFFDKPQDHLNPALTGKWDLTSVHRIDIVSFYIPSNISPPVEIKMSTLTTYIIIYTLHSSWLKIPTSNFSQHS